MSKEIKGLKKLRANSQADVPLFSCDNCKCRRYSACGCTKKENKNE